MNRTISSTSTAWVVGADLDQTLVKSLGRGDRVMCEMNGARIYSGFSNPMVAEEPWIVVSNDSKKLTLRHPSVTNMLVLPYSGLLKISPKEPAVFDILDSNLSPGKIYVVLQFASHRITAEEIEERYPMSFDAELLVKEARQEIVDRIVETIQDFSHPGWGYMSVCRFSLRSNVRAKVVAAFREGNRDVINQQDDETILKMMKEINWLPYLISASNPYNFREEYDSPTAAKSH